jgi:SAM-dependent methyltransferase
MPTIAPATSPDLASVQPELPSVSFLGRSLAEYCQFFALELPAFRGRDVLDVGGGSSSFTAEACARKINAVAVDPSYGCSPGVLATQLRLDSEHRVAELRHKPRTSRASTLAALPTAEIDYQGATQRFLADYETHFISNRYVCGSLPRLPFFDGTFDLVLCSHLLFFQSSRFDYDWHLAACRELVRVTVEEVRIFPLGGADGRTYPALARLRRELRESGIATTVQAVDYEFHAGRNSMLVLRSAAP